MNNDFVPDPPDTPGSLEAAEKRFGDFLAKHGHPREICWVTPDDVIRYANQYSVRWLLDKGRAQAELQYAAGIRKGLGIELRALTFTPTETIATIYIPTDEEEAQYHLMPFGLKCSFPVEKTSVRIVKSRLKWFFLWRRDGGRSRAFWESWR